ncbi:ABC-F family ATP-binding cassette domain-containing protein [Bacillaceae bacterium SIJ1]|uniref:ABC-F family ATP-binding cassette domain-containing protein n=1 Tax=Litoribacterium kuwaitense TaxID=1398745 RepID=UPI0013EAE2F4|nr:ABC-F family ATP-binding cassette domain-containing protein [Litoribacterium kuwaitense]NGP46550.1 ABC-F family ATP-binding cassette domain-containing protein [Litoribacterium kuwaitense]
MIILQINDLEKAFGATTILSNIKMEIKSQDRIAVVGRNGAGKSTLLKIIAGELSYDSGAIIQPNSVQIGYLPQQATVSSENTIWDEMLEEFQDLLGMERRIRALEKQMGSAEVLENETLYTKVMKEYDALRASFEQQNGYQLEADIRGILNGLQFQQFDYYTTKVSALSGGQKTRLALGKLLLKKPDLLILDEPTNHLDIDTLTWLEGYLQNYPGALLLVSHDRYFLDKIVTEVYEIARHRSTKYIGNYSAYQQAKYDQFERDVKEFEKQQKEKQRMEDFVQRNLARASTTKRAQSRRKQLEKTDWMERPAGDDKSVSFSFETTKLSGHDVLIADKITLQYENQMKPLFQNASFSIHRGDRVALVGPNGVGKTSLFKLLCGKLAPKEGSYRWGSSVKIGYYDQEQSHLNSNKTVLQELWDRYPAYQEKDIRTILGNFLFSGDDCLKIVNDLSGGEKARLALSILMLQKANVLLLDEPTNHLDLDAKEVLESALIDFPGTILFISHDRYFMNRLADRVFDLKPTGVTPYLGHYDEYVDKLEEERERKALAEKETLSVQQNNEPPTERKLSFEQQKEDKRKKRQLERQLVELETQLETAEDTINQLEQRLLEPEVYEDHEKAKAVQVELDEANQRLEDLLIEWETYESQK